MKVKQEKISEHMYLVAVADSEDLVIACATFADEDSADTCAKLLCALLEKFGLDLCQSLDVRRIPFNALIDSLHTMERTGIGLAIEEVI